MSLLNGLAEAGKSVSQFAGVLGVEAMKSQLEEERTRLASELAEGRETRGRADTQAFQTREREAGQAFQKPLQDQQILSSKSTMTLAQEKADREKAAGQGVRDALTGGTGGNDSYEKTIAGAESRGGKMIPNELGSGAYGPYQFMPGTWADVRSKNGDLNLPEDMKTATPEQHKAAFDRFTAGNAQSLQKAGVEPTPANLYLAHRFGAGGATTVAKADENAKLADILPPEWQNQNPDMRGQTAGSFKRLADERMKGVTPGGGGTVGGADVPADFKAVVAAVAMSDPDKAGQMWAAYRRQQLENDKPTDAVKTIIDAAKLTPEQWKTAQRLQQLKQEAIKPGEGYRWTATGEQEAISGGPADPTVIARNAQAKNQQPMTEDQSKAAGFSDRMLNSNGILFTGDKEGKSAWGRALEAAGSVGNLAQKEGYQKFMQARDDFINAELRRESGAAISDKEYSRADKQYFPMPGDAQSVIEQKAKNRQLAVDGMLRSAGPNYKTGANVDAGRGGNPMSLIDEARDAIYRGAPVTAVMQELRKRGIDPAELDR